MADSQIPMLLAKVEGSLVAPMQDAHVAGRKLLLLRPQFVDDQSLRRFRSGSDAFVAVDTVGAAVAMHLAITLRRQPL